MSSNRSLLAIDPGLNSLGWAFWLHQSSMLRPPFQVGLIKAPRKLELTARALWIAQTLDKTLLKMAPHISIYLDRSTAKVDYHEIDFVSEFPAWHGIQLGWAAGDLQKLVFLVGVLAGYFCEAHSFTPVTPKDWKGQLPKEVVKRRLVKRYGPGATREWEKDVWDAVGIGLWKMGKF